MKLSEIITKVNEATGRGELVIGYCIKLIWARLHEKSHLLEAYGIETEGRRGMDILRDCAKVHSYLFPDEARRFTLLIGSVYFMNVARALFDVLDD